MLEMDTYDEPDPDSDLDYEETYSKKKRGKRGVGRVSQIFVVIPSKKISLSCLFLS